jgi:hypothetical protein
MRHRLTDPAAIEAAIAGIPLLALDALRQRWRAVFGRIPPRALSKDLLGRMIACRLQERAFGGLDRESLRFLDSLARHGGSPRCQLKPGTVLVRDYQGQRHTVTVAPDGFDWQGTSYASLSDLSGWLRRTALVPTCQRMRSGASRITSSGKRARACIQLGGVCQGTEQNQTRNSVL